MPFQSAHSSKTGNKIPRCFSPQASCLLEVTFQFSVSKAKYLGLCGGVRHVNTDVRTPFAQGWALPFGGTVVMVFGTLEDEASDYLVGRRKAGSQLIWRFFSQAYMVVYSSRTWQGGAPCWEKAAEMVWWFCLFAPPGHNVGESTTEVLLVKGGTVKSRRWQKKILLCLLAA